MSVQDAFDSNWLRQDTFDSKWWRLAFLCFLLAIAAGLSPAAASYVDFFSRSGVLSWMCNPGENQCESQQAHLGQTLLDAMTTAKSVEVCGALVYQQYGAAVTLRLAGYLHVGGWLLIFALHSFQFDRGWASAIITIDCSRGLIKYVPYAFLEEFPGQAATVLSWGNAGHNAAAMPALAFISIVDATHLGLRGLALIQILCGLILRTTGPKALPEFQHEEPDKAEKHDSNEEALAGEDKEEWPCNLLIESCKETYVYMRPDIIRHTFVLAVLGIGPLWSAQYQAIAVAYCTLLFPTQTAVHTLSLGITISSFIANCAFSPLAALFLERFGLSAFLLGLSFLQISCLPLIATASILCQSYIGLIGFLLLAVEPALSGLHLFAYVDVRWSGMAAAVWNLKFLQFYSCGMVIETKMFDLAAKGEHKLQAYHATLLTVLVIGCCAYTAYAILTVFLPTPEKPVIPPEKQAELCKPYGCRNLHEVAKILNYPLDLAEQTVLQPVQGKKSKSIIISRTRVHAVREQLGHLSYDSISELLTSGKFIWNPQHETKKPQKGFMMAGIVMPAAKLEQALRSQANVDSFGQGTSKSLNHLKREMSQHKSSFLVDEDDPTKLLRVTNIAVLRISVHFQGQPYFLIEVGEEYEDGSTKQYFRFPATKKEPGQSFQAAILKVLGELGMKDMAAKIVNEPSETSVESVESESYPGLLTRYVKSLADVSIVPDDPCEEIVLPSGGRLMKNINRNRRKVGLSGGRPKPWTKIPIDYSSEDSTRLNENRKAKEMYEWLREDEISNRCPGFIFHYQTKLQSVRKNPADVGLDLITVMRARGAVTAIIRNAHKNDLSKLSKMLMESQSATYIQSLPYWLEASTVSYYRSKILEVLRSMIHQGQQPDKRVLIESLLLEVLVEQRAATDMLRIHGLL